MDYPSNRTDAKASGATHYFTGKPCSRGHIALRKTKGTCVECMKEDWTIDNEKRKDKPKSEASKAAARRYYERNKEAVKARASARPAEEKRRNKDAHRAANLDYYKALVSVRKRRHREATPKWVTPEDKRLMRQYYLEAVRLTKKLNERYVIDHIYPLRSEVVCGLHVPWNLRIITQKENLEKSNKMPDDSEALAFPPRNMP